MNNKLKDILKKFKEEIKIINDIHEWYKLKSQYLGKKSELNKIFKQI